MSLPGKRITQNTFDEVVRENIEDLELDPDEAIADAIEQFKAQGVELNNIITDIVFTTDGSSWHPIINIINRLKTIEISNRELLCEELSSLQTECDKSLAHRVLATKQASGFLTILDIYDKLDPDDIQIKTELLKTWSSYLNGQPDCVFDRVMDVFIHNMESEDVSLCLYALRLIKFSCIMHENNRQAFVTKEIIPKLASVLKRHKSNAAIVMEACQCLRTLTLDDDPRVPFGKAHDHAKMIVTEGGALDLLLNIAQDYDKEAILGELFSTLGRLAVRNEFCQQIVDLGGLDLMLKVLQDNISNKNTASKVIGVFKSIAGNDDVKIALAKSDAPSLIVEAMDRHQSSEVLCTNACSCLATIALRNANNVKKIIDSHGHVAIVQCMKIHPHVRSIQKQACMALRNLVARTREYCNVILALGAEELINNALKFDDVVDEAKAALRDLGCKVELTERWTGEKGSIGH